VGKKINFGIHQQTYSLKHILSNRKDFQEEELCHCELAGKGIEFS
jgi:hypothetical protein